MRPSREVYSLADLRDWSTATAGNEPPLRLAVLGDPVAHSASPPMHNAGLAAAGIHARYTRLHIPPHELADALPLLAVAGFIGANLTIPHKAAALTLLDKVDAHAAALGVINTIRVEDSGRLRGFNTDGPGFEQAIQAEFGVNLRDLRVLILGAGGGAGRAVAAQCVAAGCPQLALVNRTIEKTRMLAEELRIRYPDRTEITTFPWEMSALAKALPEVDLVVNTSAMGLKPGDTSPLPGEIIPANLLVFDTVYRTDRQRTPLVEAAQTNGARAVGGMSLLLYQGALAFEHWFARPAPVDVMRRALENIPR